MSEFNHFAKELDEAFRTARSEYAAVYDELTKAKENASTAGLDAVKKQIATLQLQEAEKKMRQETGRIWSVFDAKAAELRSALEKEVQTSNLADPSAIDSNAVELMKTGVLTVDDYFGFADRYGENPTIHFVASLSILLWWLVALCIRLWSAVMQRAFSYAWIRFLSCIAVSYNI